MVESNELERIYRDEIQMRTIIAGSRSITSMEVLETAIDSITWEITRVISGCANGVDKLGADWANSNQIPVHYYPADWDKYGKRAGFKRNVEMSKYADALLAVWDGESKGTKHMINIAKKKGLKVKIFEVNDDMPTL